MSNHCHQEFPFLPSENAPTAMERRHSGWTYMEREAQAMANTNPLNTV